ncbi:MAG TPA: hypothetical protein VF699_11450 [Caulobacteraceae bacterium]
MARYPYVLSALAVLVAFPAAAAEPAAVPPGMKALQLQVCDRGPFKRRAWNEDFGRVRFEVYDRPARTALAAKDPKVRCITEENLARLKARQSASLTVIDPRERR